MLTVTGLTNGEYLISSVAMNIDEYYAGAGESPGVWTGRWAERLGLSGVVDADQLRSLVDGLHPVTGESLVSARARSVRAFDVTLSAPYARAVTGQVTLMFQPSGPAGRDDPSIQFSTGGRTLSFTVAAGNTHATFPASTVAFQTGTVGGTITLTVSSDLPGGTPSSSATVAPTAPGIQSMTVVTNSTGFQVQIAGFSNSRDLTAASFHFTAASGQTLQTSDLTVDLSSLASQWYSGTSSSQFGGAFLLVVPFIVQQGASSGLASVSVQLRNTQGTSSAGSASF